MALGHRRPGRGAPGARPPTPGRRAKPKPAPAKPAATKPPAQRARLPKRLAADFRSHIETRLPHLRPSFEAAGRETGLNWRMLAALGYQESRWRPAAVSPRGAQGVMMLMPLTATKMGVKNVFSPDENIMAGSRYLLYMKERIPKRIRDPDRTLLAMAAYNIGIGHLEDARIITQMRKKNPDRWADVRANLPRLSDPRGTSASSAVTPTAARPRSSSSASRSSRRSSKRPSPTTSSPRTSPELATAVRGS